MISEKAFKAGLKELKLNFGLDPDNEQKTNWYKHLQTLNDKEFFAGVWLMTEKEEKIYPNDNVVFKIKKWAEFANEQARRKLAAIEFEREHAESKRLVREQALKLEQRAHERLKFILANNRLLLSHKEFIQ